MFRLAILLAVCATIAANVHDRAYYEAKFYNWMQEHGVKPAVGQKFVHWLENFANNDDIIEAHNAKESTFKLGHNQFSHMNLDEWKAFLKLGLGKPDGPKAEFFHEAPAGYNSTGSVDWVTAGAVTPVKNQGQCGSCWSFSTTGALEGAFQIKNGKLDSFSEQQLVSCDTTNSGCNGGWMDTAFVWIRDNGGICSENSYPYTSGTTQTSGTCQKTCSNIAGSAPRSYTDVQPKSDAAMMSALDKQPVSVAIQADQSTFQLYKSGVFTDTCGAQLDHGVLTVGYGNLDGTDYYNVKNSWGVSWGMNGYILLERGGNQNKGAGQCGILSAPSYPNL